MKKAIVPLWLSVFFALLAVVLLLVFYFFFVQGERTPREVSAELSIRAVTRGVLVNYLNAPVKVDDEVITFADLIRLWYYDRKKYEKVLKQQTENEFLPRASAPENFLRITIHDQKNNKKEFMLMLGKPLPRKPDPIIYYLPAEGATTKKATYSLPEKALLLGRSLPYENPQYLPTNGATIPLPVRNDHAVLITAWSAVR